MYLYQFINCYEPKRTPRQIKQPSFYTSIDHRNKSSFLRTKTSATDNRPSSVSIGITGVILLVFVMLFIILLDILPRN